MVFCELLCVSTMIPRPPIDVPRRPLIFPFYPFLFSSVLLWPSSPFTFPSPPALSCLQVGQSQHYYPRRKGAAQQAGSSLPPWLHVSSGERSLFLLQQHHVSRHNKTSNPNYQPNVRAQCCWHIKMKLCVLLLRMSVKLVSPCAPCLRPWGRRCPSAGCAAGGSPHGQTRGSLV